VLNNNVTLLCGGNSLSSCLGTTYNGPNGIVLYTDKSSKKWLLVAVVPNKLVKIDVDTGEGFEVESGVNTASNALYNLDGMSMFDGGYLNSVLFAVGKIPGTNGK
jgi:hypothetical protein